MTARKGVEHAILDDGRRRLELGWKPRRVGAPAAPELLDETDWPKLHGRVRCEAGEWEFCDSSLSDREIFLFARFLEARPWPSGARFVSMDRCIAASANGPAGRHLALAIEFRGEVSSPWLWGDADAVWQTGFTLEMTPDDAGLLRFACRIRDLLGIEPLSRGG